MSEISHPTASQKPKEAIGPRLRYIYSFVLLLVALLVANSLYLSGITTMEWLSGKTFQNYFYQLMFLGHIVLGLLLVVPFVVFAVAHFCNTRHRKNKRAIRVGYALLGASLVLLVSGLLLVRVFGLFDLKTPWLRSTVYWLHISAPFAVVWLYWLHRLVGPKINWKLGFSYLFVTSGLVLFLISLHTQAPRQWNVAGPASGMKYFEPSLARTATGKFISAQALMMDHYCLECHADVHADWANSVHRFSSFNNPAYLASIRETRAVLLKRDKAIQASRWCAGCHDPVPFFSGAFDDPEFDDINHPTAQAGITCTVCHAITHVNSVKGNADYTIEEPQHYPFAYSDNAVLKWINRQLVKAKPALHKKTFLKSFHHTAEFCSTCHKVHLPYALNHYKAFLRGQNHYDSFLLSGISGQSARSFYYPKIAEQNCNRCHLPLKKSNDFAAGYFDESGELKIHDHLFPAANTGVAWFRHKPDIIKRHQEYLQNDILRVDIFGIKNGSTIDAELQAPIRPNLPELEPGHTYLLEIVIRTLQNLGHHFTQGTADSNEIWLDVTLTSGNKVIGRSGALNEENHVDPWSHFINVFMLDRNGYRIDRRNVQDIFTPLYNNQIPPGTGQVAHYKFTLPPEINQPVEIAVKLQYRKFDPIYLDYIAKKQKPSDTPLRGYRAGKPYRNQLPITTIAEDKVALPVRGVDMADREQTTGIPEWQRWNDYGIGLFSKGKAELRQAEHAFHQVEQAGRYDGPLNLARVYYREGRLDAAVSAIERASAYGASAAPAWTMAWLSGLINQQQGHLIEAERNLRSALYDQTDAMRQRGFDFSKDYVVINQLGQTLFDLAKQQRGEKQSAARVNYLNQSVEQFQRALIYDPENVTAHYNLQLLYQQLDNKVLAKKHRILHAQYKPDDNARDRAIAAARKRYPAANHASQSVVIYPLQRTVTPKAVQQ